MDGSALDPYRQVDHFKCMHREEPALDNIPFSDLRANLTETLGSLDSRTKPLVIARRGRRTAVLLSVPQYEALVNERSADDGPAAQPNPAQDGFANRCHRHRERVHPK